MEKAKKWTKAYTKEYQRNYHKKNKERIKEIGRLYRLKNKDKLKKQHQKYYPIYWKKNRELINKIHREYYLKTKGKWHKEYQNKNGLFKLEKQYCRYYQYTRFKKGIKNYNPNYSEYEDNLLKKYYGKIYNKEIIKKYLPNRDYGSMIKRAIKLGLKSDLHDFRLLKKILISRNKRLKGLSLEQILGKEKALEVKQKLSLKSSGKNNYFYAHGKGNEPYPMGWANHIKNKIRNRYKYCAICKRKKDNISKFGEINLDVHHIDRNKHNLSEENLIPLCRVHHSKIQSIQDELQDHFHAKIMKLI